MFKKFTTAALVAAVFGSLLPISSIGTAQAQTAQKSFTVSPEVLRQVSNRLQQKYGQTVSQTKLNDQLRTAAERLRGRSAAVPDNVPPEKFVVNDKGLIAVDISTANAKRVSLQIKKLGGSVVFVSQENNFIQAYVPFDRLQTIVEQAEVQRISPSVRGETQRIDAPPEFLSRASGFVERLSQVGITTSEGDVTHRAAEARARFNVNGSGVKIGVISDSVRFLDRSQASGDLPPNVTVIAGQSGVLTDESDIGEGTAMLEIIHDIAPGAELYFATGFSNGNQNPVLFANNIRALRAAGCQIIVDDLVATYGPDGTPFQDVIVGRAINEVTAAGVLYLSAAGNAGNLNDNTSGVWEGDFNDSGVTVTDENGNAFATLHNFGNDEISNVINNVGSGVATLWWADAVGASANDYDVFLLNAEGTEIIAGSLEAQDGNDSPFEFIFLSANSAGTQLLIARKIGAQPRALHLSVDRGALSRATAGQIRGHNAAQNALSIAATPGGVYSFNVGPISPFPAPFNAANQVERFSSDGYRRIFYDQNGRPVSRFSNSFLFQGIGGITLFKPNFTAADGVVTTFPLFSNLNPFFGTSAAAPHAAAIAALAKSANRAANRQQLISYLGTGVIDIEARFIDRDSGSGIIDAFNAVSAAKNPRGGGGSGSGSCSSNISNGVCTVTRCVNGVCSTRSFTPTPTDPCSCSL